MWTIATDIQNRQIGSICVGVPEEATCIIDYFQGNDICGEKTNEAKGRRGKLVPTWRSKGDTLEGDGHALHGADITVGSRRE
jgi:hypothetical protein